MLLTKRNEYALQAMIIVARQKYEMAVSAAELARSLRTTPAFMSKIAQQLARAGLLETKRGKSGGLFLAVPPDRIYIGDIFKAVDGILRVSSCMDQGRCKHHVCPVYPALRKLQKDLDENLNSARLSSLL